MSLDNQVAIVTGASRGIGEYIARSLAKAGARVAVAARTEEVTDPRLPGTIHSVAETIRSEGGTALPLRMDMRDPASIEEGVRRVVDEWGRLDIVVNNAAVLVPGSIEDFQERHLDLIWQIDLRGPILLIKHAVPHLKAGRGRIINVSSIAGIFPGPGPYEDTQRVGLAYAGGFYGMVKAGLERISQGLAMELQPHGITVNVLSPRGGVKTPGNLFARNDREHPNLNFDEAWQMGNCATWICEQESDYTGHILFAEDVAAEHGL